jgi:16S rRNA (uracil1498-N3)-methyltransferase
MAQRYFVADLPGPGPLRLDPDLAHHLGTVLRCRAGDTIRLADGRGGSALATILAAERRRVEVEVGPAEFRPRPVRRVHLAFAPPRHNRAEWLFEHATEVGVAVFWPLWTERTRPQGERADRWHKILLAAAGQSDRDWLPELRGAIELREFLAHPGLPAARCLAAADGPPLARSHEEVVLLVGPEGGFTDAERAAATASGFVPSCFGPHVLRTETAALVGAALLMQ